MTRETLWILVCKLCLGKGLGKEKESIKVAFPKAHYSVSECEAASKSIFLCAWRQAEAA
jgi:hypothetical protein